MVIEFLNEKRILEHFLILKSRNKSLGINIYFYCEKKIKNKKLKLTIIPLLK